MLPQRAQRMVSPLTGFQMQYDQGVVFPVWFPPHTPWFQKLSHCSFANASEAAFLRTSLVSRPHEFQPPPAQRHLLLLLTWSSCCLKKTASGRGKGGHGRLLPAEWSSFPFLPSLPFHGSYLQLSEEPQSLPIKTLLKHFWCCQQWKSRKNLAIAGMLSARSASVALSILWARRYEMSNNLIPPWKFHNFPELWTNQSCGQTEAGCHGTRVGKRPLSWGCFCGKNNAIPMSKSLMGQLKQRFLTKT